MGVNSRKWGLKFVMHYQIFEIFPTQIQLLIHFVFQQNHIVQGTSLESDILVFLLFKNTYSLSCKWFYLLVI